MSANNPHFTSKSLEWETPQDLFDRLHTEFDFTLDAAASSGNAKLPRFFSFEQDGLAQEWDAERVWCNPPYGRQIGRWIEKAATSNAEVAVLLIPARTDTRAWHEHIFGKAEIRFIPGRVNFVNREDVMARSRAPFPAAIVVFRKGSKTPKYKDISPI